MPGLPQDGPCWHEEYSEFKSNQNPADAGKALYCPLKLPKKNLDRGPAPKRVLSSQRTTL